MAWIRIDDQFADHPKFLDIRRDLADAALALWARALGYCNKQRTDGVIVRGAIYQLSCAKKPETVAAELVRVGLWEATERGWLVHDYHVYQPHSGKAQATKEQLSAAGRKAASARWGRRASADATACESHAPSDMPGCEPHATEMPPIPIPSPEISTGTLRGGSETFQPPRAPAKEPPDHQRPANRFRDLEELTGDAKRVYAAMLWRPSHWDSMRPGPLAHAATIDLARGLAAQASDGGKLEPEDVLYAVQQFAEQEVARMDTHQPPTEKGRLAATLSKFVGRMRRGEARERAAGQHGRGGQARGAPGTGAARHAPPADRAWQAQDAEISDEEVAQYALEDERRRAARRAGEQVARGGAGT